MSEEVQVSSLAAKGGNPGSSLEADNKAVVLMREDSSRPKYVVLFFYLTFAFLAVIGAVVLQFVFNPSARATDPDKNEFEVLTLPGSNTNCNVRPDPDTLQFCVMTWGCKDTPETPGGRCGLGAGSVFYTGNAFICVSPSNKKRILGASGVFSRQIRTFSLSCAGQHTGTSSCLNQVLPKSSLSCELFWPTLRSVISQNIPSSRNITDPSGSFQIQGAVDSDSKIWFNMCGFCSLATYVEMCAPLVDSRHAARIFFKPCSIPPLLL
jgi:hypothetical protein